MKREQTTTAAFGPFSRVWFATFFTRSSSSSHIRRYSIDLFYILQCPKLHLRASVSPMQMWARTQVHHPLSSPFPTTTITPIGDKIGDRLWPPRSVPNKASQGESGFIDSSGPILSMYMEMAEEEDKKLAESWKADADGILIFVRLYLLAPCSTPIH